MNKSLIQIFFARAYRILVMDELSSEERNKLAANIIVAYLNGDDHEEMVEEELEEPSESYECETCDSLDEESEDDNIIDDPQVNNYYRWLFITPL